MKRIGPTFANEIDAAGLSGLPFAWGENGSISGRENLTPEQNAALDAVIAAHDPAFGDLAAYVAQRRWEIETGGITVAGASVATDDRSKLMLLGKRTKAKEDPSGSTRWKGQDGKFIDLPHSAIIATADAVEAHVQACFDKEDEILAMIEAGTITDTAGIEAELAKIPAAY